MPPILITPRLVLRMTGLDDAQAYFDMRSSPRFLEASGATAPHGVQEIQQHLKNIIDLTNAGVASSWTITLSGTGEMIGEIGLFPLSPLYAGWEEWGISYALSEAYWRRGFAKEALRSVLDFAFSKAIFRIKADVALTNLASIALLEHLGFAFEAVQKMKAISGVERVDMASYVMLAPDYPAAQAGASRFPGRAPASAITAQQKMRARLRMFGWWFGTALLLVAVYKTVHS